MKRNTIHWIADAVRPYKKVLMLIAGLLIIFATGYAILITSDMGISVMLPIGAILIFCHLFVRNDKEVLSYDSSLTPLLYMARVCLEHVLVVSLWLLKFISIEALAPAFFWCLYSEFLSFALHLMIKEVLFKIRQGASNTTPLIIFGAGEAGAHLYESLLLNNHYRIVGFVDEDESKASLTFGRVKVYNPSRLSQIAKTNHGLECFIAIPSATTSDLSRIKKLLTIHGIKWEYLPRQSCSADAINISHTVPEELDEFVGRSIVEKDFSLIELDVKGRCVLITGAGGSIGSELVRQVVLANPRIILCVDNCEYNLYQLENELKSSTSKNCSLKFCLIDITNTSAMNHLFSEFKPETVYHAAAYKHVPLVEYNVCSAARNNIIGTKILVDLSLQHEVHKFVLISTDKAVRPPNVMGATKRIAELIVQDASSRTTKSTFTMVRFGNVIGSSGSVIPLFKKQIFSGGPVTVTHQEVTRFFMTIPEAAELVIQAGALASGGEVYLLDMGDPIRIYDLAEKMIDYYAPIIGERVKISVTGLRPGEKIHEELLIDSFAVKTRHSKIFKAREPSLGADYLFDYIQRTKAALEVNDDVAIRKLLNKMIGGTLHS